MLRLLLAKQSCRIKGRLQYREFSSVSEKAVSKFFGYCVVAAFGGGGFLLGGVTTSPVSKGLRENEELFIKDLLSLEKMEASMGKWTEEMK
ncbi:hypothetical protein F2Q69_00032982 [Brassica cretica]|uniref:Uncharacterized protein n=1 Tax=Brassica cretica TaxID=69181 RepID=A0A8S9SUM7_BRACR|nr:hypothetical protein F2Q69_00032982 [Brassica cretica]